MSDRSNCLLPRAGWSSAWSSAAPTLTATTWRSSLTASTAAAAAGGPRGARAAKRTHTPAACLLAPAAPTSEGRRCRCPSLQSLFIYLYYHDYGLPRCKVCLGMRLSFWTPNATEADAKAVPPVMACPMNVIKFGAQDVLKTAHRPIND